MARKNEAYLGIYGDIPLTKGWCTECERHAFIIDGKLARCDAVVSQDPKRFKLEVHGSEERKTPPIADQRVQLDLQENKCLYCEREFGSYVYRRGKAHRLKINWDHFIPYSYSRSSPSSNFVAACHICNGIKSDLIFQTVEEARIHILERRRAKGYNG